VSSENLIFNELIKEYDETKEAKEIIAYILTFLTCRKKTITQEFFFVSSCW
jgi:hypothetical protein